MPPMTDMRTAVCTVRRTVSPSRWPTALAMTTLAPRAMPTNRLMTRPITGLLAPTAATAMVRNSPVKLPTTARSEALNSCSSTAVAATGRAYRGSLFQMGPFSISSGCFCCVASMACPFSNIKFFLVLSSVQAIIMPRRCLGKGAKNIPARTAGRGPGGRMICKNGLTRPWAPRWRKPSCPRRPDRPGPGARWG